MFAKTALKKQSWLLSIVAASTMLCACAKQATPQQVAEQAPVPPPTEATAKPAPPAEFPKLAPTKLEEVQEAVNRVFKTAVVIDRDRNPGFLVGDFNGDQSQDLAVILKPADGKLSELNQEFPNWIAREPVKDILLSKSKVLTVAARNSSNPAAGQTIRFEAKDLLLAIIHGNGPKGWRDPEATQTHLLRDVIGNDMTVMPFKVAAKTYGGIRPFPTIYGDLIQQKLIGQQGFLHFTGGVYGWYDPKHYSPDLGPVHARMSRMK